MLINSVILFLRDALPVFILIGIFLSFGMQTRRGLMPSLAIGLVISVLVYSNMSWLSEQAEGAGFELFKSVLLALNYLACAVFFVVYQHLSSLLKQRLLMVSMSCIVIINGSSFLVYFAGYWSTDESGLSLPLGTILGLGINLSVAALAYLGLSMLRSVNVRLYVFLVFTVGQTAHLTALLQQIDWISSNSRVWDTGWLISDVSEYGHLLHAMIGYEATPSEQYVLTQIFTLMLPIILKLYLTHKHIKPAAEVNS